MVLASILSVQCGAALATSIFDEVGPAGTVLLRSLFAALVLWAIARPSLRGQRERLADILLFAVTLAGMNLCFYGAIERLPLGVAVTLEFTGPLAVAVLGSRRRRDLLWAVAAAAGIVLLAEGGFGGGSDAVGLLLALGAGAFWGAYILLGARLGRNDPGLGGLALAMAASTVLTAPFGIAAGGADLLVPATLAVGLGVGVLSSAIPYGLELEALRRLPQAVFGVLMSLEPAIAALIGFLFLSQDLAAAELGGIALVVGASAGALGSARGMPAPRDG
jgi:inner membrane transporter RhtA